MAPVADSILISIQKRDSTCTDQGCADLPTSNWLKSGVPAIIGVILFIIVFVILFVIIRKHRKRANAREQAIDGKIDMDDVEDRQAFRQNHRPKM